ncbi:MAG: type II toxin-antitoxin system HicB family antitoxin [Ruminococcus sp.]|nr:type II toxin-antitoxin system HicB family antitoxin [Ruminococcus sp.]
MKVVFPVIISTEKTEKYHDVYVPDLEINTEGESIIDAIAMARDAIGLKCITMQDLNQEIPQPTEYTDIAIGSDEFVTLVDIDLSEYRKKNESRTVKKNCTLPSWLCYEAEKANINFSAVLQAALKQELHINS